MGLLMGILASLLVSEQVTTILEALYWTFFLLQLQYMVSHPV